MTFRSSIGDYTIRVRQRKDKSPSVCPWHGILKGKIISKKTENWNFSKDMDRRTKINCGCRFLQKYEEMKVDVPSETATH